MRGENERERVCVYLAFVEKNASKIDFAIIKSGTVKI
jgi:hypothetical protein